MTITLLPMFIFLTSISSVQVCGFEKERKEGSADDQDTGKDGERKSTAPHAHEKFGCAAAIKKNFGFWQISIVRGRKHFDGALINNALDLKYVSR